MAIEKETTLIKVNNKCDSLRTTMPKSIKELLGLKEGNKIRWVCKCGKRVSVEIFPSTRNNGGGA